MAVALQVLLGDLRDDVEALLEDLIADEVDHNVAAMWAGEQFNGLVLSGAGMSRLFDRAACCSSRLAG